MSWGGPGGLTGAAVMEEQVELEGALELWRRKGVLVAGEIIWDPQNGEHWVKIETSFGERHEMQAPGFETYCMGLADMARHLGKGE